MSGRKRRSKTRLGPALVVGLVAELPACSTRERTRDPTATSPVQSGVPTPTPPHNASPWCPDELVQARQHGWESPVYEVKADCDRNYEALTRTLVHARPLVRVAIASHNLRSVAHAAALGRLAGGEERDIEFQVLRGLGDELQDALAATGRRVRTYCPIGDLVAGMAYLVRRLLENTSNESFLHEQARGTPLEQLLAAP